ncbi:MAG: dihydropteroate synthase [Gammaproteobacteria bacterium]|nr:dihydropteroate synthase [Gammaproteobacteria bacterium]
MGVLNVTPDSFSDGGRFDVFEAAVARGLRMLEEGADIIDIGGESTRPGADPVPLEEELRRVVPVVRELVTRGARVSIDTSKPEVIRAAIDVGAHMINDVYALRLPGALQAAAASRAAVCVMHMQGEPRSMQREPRYADVVGEVGEFLATRVAACEAAGIARERLVIDPGFGFGKTVEHNLELLRELRKLGAGLASAGTCGPLPLLAGLSRKSMLGAITGRGVEARLAGSLALAFAALDGGARIIRCHDVAETRDVLKVWAALRGPGGAA